MKINLGKKVLELNFSFKPNLEYLRKDLEQYFSNHKIDGMQIKKFSLGKEPVGFSIIPEEPYFEESLSEGKYQEDLEKMGRKFGIEHLGFVSWCYHK